MTGNMGRDLGDRVAGRLQHLSRRVARLTPDRRDPERFFEERSELADELREIATKLQAQQHTRSLPCKATKMAAPIADRAADGLPRVALDTRPVPAVSQKC